MWVLSWVGSPPLVVKESPGYSVCGGECRLWWLTSHCWICLHQLLSPFYGLCSVSAPLPDCSPLKACSYLIWCAFVSACISALIYSGNWIKTDPCRNLLPPPTVAPRLCPWLLVYRTFLLWIQKHRRFRRGGHHDALASLRWCHFGTFALVKAIQSLMLHVICMANKYLHEQRKTGIFNHLLIISLPPSPLAPFVFCKSLPGLCVCVLCAHAAPWYAYERDAGCVGGGLRGGHAAPCLQPLFQSG